MSDKKTKKPRWQPTKDEIQIIFYGVSCMISESMGPNDGSAEKLMEKLRKMVKND